MSNRSLDLIGFRHAPSEVGQRGKIKRTGFELLNCSGHRSSEPKPLFPNMERLKSGVESQFEAFAPNAKYWECVLLFRPAQRDMPELGHGLANFNNWPSFASDEISEPPMIWVWPIKQDHAAALLASSAHAETGIVPDVSRSIATANVRVGLSLPFNTWWKLWRS